MVRRKPENGFLHCKSAGHFARFRISYFSIVLYISRMKPETAHQPNQICGQRPQRPRPFWQHIAIGVGLLLAAWFVLPLDVLIAENGSSKDWPGDLRRVIKLSEIFAHGFGVALIVAAIWLLATEKRKYLPRLIACVAFPPITAHLVKLVVVRKRPTEYLDHWLQPHYPASTAETWEGVLAGSGLNVQYATQAFPSAHAALVCGLAIGLAFIYPKGRSLFVFVAILACIQRITFLAHWTSDVFVGASLGFLIAGGLVQNWGIGYLCGRLENPESTPATTTDTLERRAA